MSEEGGQLWNMSIPSGEGGQPWDLHIESSAEMQAREAAERWAMHERHEANVRAIAQRHAEGRQREHSRPRFQRSHHSGRVCHTGQRHTYHSVFSLRGSGETPGHGRGQGKGFWATLREWFPVFFGG